MSKIYIYTERRARIGGKNKFVDLIPKLGDLFYSSGESVQYEVIETIKKEHGYVGDKDKLFRFSYEDVLIFTFFIYLIL